MSEPVIERFVSDMNGANWVPVDQKDLRCGDYVMVHDGDGLFNGQTPGRNVVKDGEVPSLKKGRNMYPTVHAGGIYANERCGLPGVETEDLHKIGCCLCYEGMMFAIPKSVRLSASYDVRTDKSKAAQTTFSGNISYMEIDQRKLIAEYVKAKDNAAKTQA